MSNRRNECELARFWQAGGRRAANDTHDTTRHDTEFLQKEGKAGKVRGNLR